MEKNAAQLLGEEVLAASPVMPAGYATKVATAIAGQQVGGLLGGIAAGTLNDRRKDPTTPGGHQGTIFMVATPTRVVFFEQKQGLLKRKLGRLFAEHPRSDLAAFEFDTKGKTNSPLNVVLNDGTVYGLAVPRVQRGKVRKVAEALQP